MSGDGDAADVGEGREDVRLHDEAVVSEILADVGASGGGHEDHGNLSRLLVEEVFGPLAVIAEHLAVIGGEHDDCVVEEALLSQQANDQPYLVIKVCAHGVEALTGDAYRVVGVGVASRPPAGLDAAGQGVPFLRPLADERHVDLAVAVHLDVLLGRDDGRVRLAERHVPESLAWSGRDRAICRDIWRTVQLVWWRCSGQVPWADDVVVVAHRVGRLLSGVALLLEEQLVVVLQQAEVVTAFLVDQRVVEPDAVVLRVDVQLAD